ncbi:hypothetical protein VNO80_31647 [Phaseolus coccineus]|uniref:Uncharacterized protein n=1 Tax=Phaseolus coccineus TaxID=3886 RepID=A0AAN9L0J8_PHACN
MGIPLPILKILSNGIDAMEEQKRGFSRDMRKQKAGKLPHGKEDKENKIKRVLELEAAALFEENNRPFLSLTFCVSISLSSLLPSALPRLVWCGVVWCGVLRSGDRKE